MVTVAFARTAWTCSEDLQNGGLPIQRTPHLIFLPIV